MNKLRLVVSTPEGTVFESDVVSVSVRGAAGDLAILAGHAPLITPLRAGKCTVLSDDDEHIFDIGRGLLSVSTEKAVVLTECATINT